MVVVVSAGIGVGIEVAYSVDVDAPGYVSVPDARCGIAYVRGGLWWLGPSSLPWATTQTAGLVVGVRLTFTAGRAVAGGPLRRWRDRRVPLNTIWDRTAVSALTDRMSANAGLSQLLETLNVEVAVRMRAAGSVAGLAEELAGRIASGSPVSAVARSWGISTRQLSRRCDDLIGMPPTALRRILRLHHAARNRASHPHLSLTDVAAAAGYADQAHLSRDSRALASSPASVALG